MAANDRSFTAGRFALDLGGKIAGYVKKVSGGQTRGEVAVHQLGPDNVNKKHISTIKHDAFTVEVGMSMSPDFYQWIQSSFDKKYEPRSGRVIAADFDYKAQSERIFTDALITEVTMPAFDGASKDPAYMTVKFDPERIEYQPGDQAVLKGAIGPVAKKWLCSNWRFELGSLPCSRVAKIDSFTWKQAVIQDEVGAFREPTKHPAKVEIPNLKLTISMADLKGWEAWFTDFVVKGNCGEDREQQGGLTWLAPDMKTELGTVEFQNVGIMSLQPAAVEANQEAVARFEVELYVEGMRFLPKVVDTL